MSNERKFIAIIPARGGSKGIARKNIRLLNNKPLIAYTILAAKNCPHISQIIVDTDDEYIADVARKYGATIPYKRPPELATDTATTIEVLCHATKQLAAQQLINLEHDNLVLLQPTSPLRTGEDISEAINLFIDNNQQGLVSISPVTKSPILIRSITTGNYLQKLLPRNSTVRRQDMPSYYYVNGAIYINKFREIKEDLSLNDNPIGYIMDRRHSVDIDTIEDFRYCEFLLNYKE